MKNALKWRIGTVVEAQAVIVDWDEHGEPRIVAKRGDLGIVFADYSNGVEVKFGSNVFTTWIVGDELADARRYRGDVFNVIAPPPGRGHVK